MNERALELLLGDSPIGGKETKDIFYRFIKNWRESDAEPASAIFDIAVQMFLP